MRNKIVALALVGLVCWNGYLTYQVNITKEATLGLAYLMLSTNKQVRDALVNYMDTEKGVKIGKGDQLKIKEGAIDSAFDQAYINSSVVKAS